MSVIDDYLQNVKPSQKAELERVRRVVKQLVPDAEEVISYGIPAFKYRKQPLLYFAAFKSHMSIYPVTDQMVEALGEKLAKYRTSKGTLQFHEDDPIPDSLLKEIVKSRLKSISKA